jgi:hypothetical protein
MPTADHGPRSLRDISGNPTMRRIGRILVGNVSDSHANRDSTAIGLLSVQKWRLYFDVKRITDYAKRTQKIVRTPQNASIASFEAIEADLMFDLFSKECLPDSSRG